MENFFGLLLFVLLLIQNVNSMNLNCDSIKENFYTAKNVSTCNVMEIYTLKYESEETVVSCRDSIRNIKTCGRFNGLIIRNKDPKFFPQNLEEFFPNLNYVHIEYCQIETIHQNNINRLNDLFELSLKGNLLKTIEINLFQSNKKLKYIDLSENQIQFINSKVFKNLGDLLCLIIKSDVQKLTVSNGHRLKYFVIKKYVEEIYRPTTTTPNSLTTTTPKNITKHQKYAKIAIIVGVIQVIIIFIFITALMIYCKKSLKKDHEEPLNYSSAPVPYVIGFDNFTHQRDFPTCPQSDEYNMVFDNYEKIKKNMFEVEYEEIDYCKINDTKI